MQDLQHSLGTRFRWFRVGLLSATVVTPLVTRWQTLRAAERARTLWEARQTAPHLSWTHRTAEEADLPPLARKSNLSTGIWLAGVVVGLVAAGTATYVLARRRQQNEGGVFELPWAHANGKGPHSAEQARAFPGGSAHAPDTSIRAARLAAEPSAAGAATPASLANGATPAVQPTLDSALSADVMEPERAPIIGNTHTQVYHEAGDANLPAEDNRIYFASAEEAEARGYRAARSEAAGAES